MKKGCPKTIASPEAQNARHDGATQCRDTNKKKIRDTMSLRTIKKKNGNTPRSAGMRDTVSLRAAQRPKYVV